MLKGLFLSPVRRRLGRIRRSRAVRIVVDAICILSRRIRQRIHNRHVLGFWRTTYAFVEDQRSALHPPSYQTFESPVSMTVPAAVHVGGARHEIMEERTFHCPETFVARLPGAMVIGHKGAVLSSDRRMLWDLSYDWPGLPYQNDVYDWCPKEDEIEELSGITATLATMGSEVNYYHFLLNALPRIDLLRRSGALDEAERILISGAVTPWIVDALGLVKVPVEKLIGTAQHSAVRCQTLIAPSLILDPFVIPRRAMSWVRNEILAHVPWEGNKRRILIDRSDASFRKIHNIDQLRPFLEGQGIEIWRLAGMSLLDQARLFQQADLVIANHGAALTNIIFCRSGTHIVQLMSEGMGENNFRPLASYCGLKLEYLTCPSAPGCEHIHSKDKNLILDAAEVSRILGKHA